MALSAQANYSPAASHIQGNVDMASGVAMAPGVLLGAAPGCRLVISAGVCLGADAVVQASQGDLVLEPGVSLGSGVLVVGHGSIGQHTCVGANSTIINPDLGASQVIAPGSLLGDPSQSGPGLGVQQSSNAGSGDRAGQAVSRSPYGGNHGNGSGLNGSSVYGKAQVNRLLTTLFPHRQALNGATPEDKP
ncbi:MAG: hypothetical protein WBA99_11285 [Nodosilinea sp.]